jgi:hypothetical protein
MVNQFLGFSNLWVHFAVKTKLALLVGSPEKGTPLIGQSHRVAVAASHIDHKLFGKCLNLSWFGVKDHAFFHLGGIVAKLAKFVLTPRENRASVRDY